MADRYTIYGMFCKSHLLINCNIGHHRYCFLLFVLWIGRKLRLKNLELWYYNRFITVTQPITNFLLFGENWGVSQRNNIKIPRRKKHKMHNKPVVNYYNVHLSMTLYNKATKPLKLLKKNKEIVHEKVSSGKKSELTRNVARTTPKSVHKISTFMAVDNMKGNCNGQMPHSISSIRSIGSIRTMTGDCGKL